MNVHGGTTRRLRSTGIISAGLEVIYAFRRFEDIGTGVEGDQQARAVRSAILRRKRPERVSPDDPSLSSDAPRRRQGAHARAPRRLRSDLIDPAIAAHHGRIVKRTGDGSIVEFRSVVDAVRCAIDVQNGLIERNAGVVSSDRDRRFLPRGSPATS